MRWLVPVTAVLLLAALAARWRASSQASQPQSEPSGWPIDLPDWVGGGAMEPTQETGLFEDIVTTFDPTNYLPANVDADTAARNVRAGLDTIAYSEGTAGHGNDGYDILYGYGSFPSYVDHPNISVTAGGWTSTAAGRYQILYRTWVPIKARLSLPDFGPASQDAAAVELIRERGALKDLQAGRFDSFIHKVRKVWASLPGAGYGQGERSLSTLRQKFAQAGGTFESQA